MSEAKTTRKSVERQSAFGVIRETAGLLVAHAPAGAVTVDRCVVTAPFTVGRSPECSFSLYDDKVSGEHFQIAMEGNRYYIQDFASTNGTFLNGVQVVGPRALGDVDVIRLGGSILVFHRKAQQILVPPPPERFGLLGPFHSGPLVQALREAAISSRHVLLVGPSGVGKELCAQTLAVLMGVSGVPLAMVAHNAARFASADEATTTMFGVGAKVFTNVESRPGLIEQANGGLLFLDEIHNLPERVQRSLLRVIEDQTFSRIGETTVRSANLRVVFASNAGPPTFCLAPDLLARLRVVSIPTLRQRVADVPHLFRQLLARALARHGLDERGVLPLLGGDHYEAICLDGFEADNVRGLLDLADRLATRIVAGAPTNEAILTVFSERFQGGLVAARYLDVEIDRRSLSHYEQHRELITAVFKQCKGNLSATERVLGERGVKCTRRWLGVFADRWGLRESKG